jgi:hypothetical protein
MGERRLEFSLQIQHQDAIVGRIANENLAVVHNIDGARAVERNTVEGLECLHPVELCAGEEKESVFHGIDDIDVEGRESDGGGGEELDFCGGESAKKLGRIKLKHCKGAEKRRKEKRRRKVRKEGTKTR